MTGITPGTLGMLALRLIDVPRNDPLAALTGRPGAVLEARVVASVRAAQPHMYEIVLQIGARQVHTRSQTPQRTGSVVRLQVMPGERLQPVAAAPATPAASVLRASPATTAGATDALARAPSTRLPAAHHQAVLERGLRLALPLQRPLALVLETLRRRGITPDAGLPAPLRAAVVGLTAAPPSASTLADPRVLQRMIRDSGVFMEAKLAASALPGRPPADLKLRLLLAAARLQGARRTPRLPRGDAAAARELLGLVRGALARVQVCQIGCLLSQQARPPGETAALEVELPVLCDGRVETVTLTIERFAAREVHGRRHDKWQVTVALDLGARGVLHAQVACCAGELAATFWGEQPTLRLVQRHVDTLSEALGRQGLQLQRIVYRAGAPPARTDHGLRRLLDLRT